MFFMISRQIQHEEFKDFDESNKSFLNPSTVQVAVWSKEVYPAQSEGQLFIEWLCEFFGSWI